MKGCENKAEFASKGHQIERSLTEKIGVENPAPPTPHCFKNYKVTEKKVFSVPHLKPLVIPPPPPPHSQSSSAVAESRLWQ